MQCTDRSSANNHIGATALKTVIVVKHSAYDTKPKKSIEAASLVVSFACNPNCSRAGKHVCAATVTTVIVVTESANDNRVTMEDRDTKPKTIGVEAYAHRVGDRHGAARETKEHKDFALSIHSPSMCT